MSCSRPFDSRTRPKTSCPSPMRRLAKCGPANPVMPVIKYFMRSRIVPLTDRARVMRNYRADHKPCTTRALMRAMLPPASRGRSRQRLLDLRLEHGVKVLRRDRADQLERDAAVAADEKCLRHAVDAPFDRGAAVLVGPIARVWVAVATEEPARVLGLVLVVDADDPDASILGHPHQQRRFLVAGHAPRGPHVEQRYRALEVGGGEPRHRRASTQQARDRRQL